MAEAPTIKPIKFWTEFEADPEKPGELRAVDWVTWVKLGTSIPATTSDRVPRLQGRGSKRPAVEWDQIAPYYTAWKQSEEIPSFGTPLIAWAGATPTLIDALKGFNVKTCEEFAAMPDHEVAKVRMPDIRVRWDAVKVFLEEKGKRAVFDEELAKRDAEIAELRALIGEKRGPGRPKKDEAA